MLYWLTHVLLVTLSKIFFPITVKGIRNIPPRTRCIIASNHASNLDPIVISVAYGRRLHFMAKDSLFRNKFFAAILRGLGAFPVKRNASDIRAIKEALQRLKAGRRMVIFPEGTRMTTYSNKKAHPGIGLIAVRSQALVVPVFIDGSGKVMPSGSKSLKYGRITVSFGKPQRYSSEQSYHAIADHIIREIESLSPRAHR